MSHKFDIQGLIKDCEEKCEKIFSVKQTSMVSKLFDKLRSKGKIQVDGMVLGVASERGIGMYEVTFSNLCTTNGLHLFLYENVNDSSEVKSCYDAVDDTFRGGELILPLRSLPLIVDLSNRTLICNSLVMDTVIKRSGLKVKQMKDLSEYIQGIPAAGGLPCNGCKKCPLICTKRISSVLTVGFASASSDVYCGGLTEVWDSYKVKGLTIASNAWGLTYTANKYKAGLTSSVGLDAIADMIKQLDGVTDPYKYAEEAKRLMLEHNAKTTLRPVFDEEKVKSGVPYTKAITESLLASGGNIEGDSEFNDMRTALYEKREGTPV